MLAEARGFRVGLTLAHQNLAQLPPELREGINTNARNKIMFSVSPDDATHLARHTLPELNPHDLAHLDAFHAAARLLHHGAETRAFTLTTRPLPTVRRAARAPPVRHPPGRTGRARPRPVHNVPDLPCGLRRPGEPTARVAGPGLSAGRQGTGRAEVGLPTRAARRDRHHHRIAVRCHPDPGVVHRVATSAAFLVDPTSGPERATAIACR